MGWIDRTPPEWIELLVEQAKPRKGLHVTDCLGCPRRRAGLAEGWTVDLARLDARLVGSIMHAKLATRGCCSETPVSGKLFGYDIEGSVDRIEHGGPGELVFTADYKTSEEYRPIPQAPYAEQVWQQECYRYLMDQVGKRTDGWRIYYRKPGKWACYEHIGPLWTEDELAAFRPHGGAFTTAEIAAQCVSGLPAASLPLAGASQKIGKLSACEYCELQVACNGAGVEVEL